MGKKLSFVYDFEDLGPEQISYDVSGSEQMSLEPNDNEAVLYVNKQACKVFSEIFAQLSLGLHPKGFHIHLRTNFDPDHSE